MYYFQHVIISRKRYLACSQDKCMIYFVNSFEYSHKHFSKNPSSQPATIDTEYILCPNLALYVDTLM